MSTTNIVRKDTSSMTAFSQDQIDLIKNTVAKGATDDELKLFLYQANKTGLDPLARQIYFVKRAGSVTIQTSIDGFRVTAERSGKYAGQDEPVFQYEEDDKGAKQLKCSIAVYKFSDTGERYKAAVGVAYWNEYKPNAGQDFMWNKMPHVMLSKVAEALALRKAFPQDLSGVYTSEEMTQADITVSDKVLVGEPVGHVEEKEIEEAIKDTPEIAEAPKESPEPKIGTSSTSPATSKQRSFISGLAHGRNIVAEDWEAIAEGLGIADIKNITKKDANAIITYLQNLPVKKEETTSKQD